MNLTISLACIVLTVAPVLSGDCQDSAFLYHYSNDTLTSNVMLNEINSRAVRSFKKEYAAISCEEWEKFASGYCVTFHCGDTAVYHVYYSPKGYFLHYDAYYNSSRIPADLLRALHYFDGRENVDIAYATGFCDYAGITYQIGMAKDETVRVIQINNDGSLKSLH